MTSSKKKELDFETSIARLEEIVSILERNDISLEESIRLFEEGTALSLQCSRKLDAAEQKITMITRGADGLEEQPFPLDKEE